MERTCLEGLGLENDVIDKVLDQNMTEIGVYATRLKNKEIEVDTLWVDLNTANSKIVELEKVDVKQLQNDLAAEKTARVKDRQHWALQSALQESGCKDPEYIMWKLGDSVEFVDSGDLKDKDGLLKTVKETYAAQFEAEPSGGTGGIGNFQRNHSTTDKPMTSEEFSKLSYMDQYNFKKQRPDEYKSLKSN